MRPHPWGGRVLAAGWCCAWGLCSIQPLAAQDEPSIGSPQDEIRKIREEMERMRMGIAAE